MTIDHDQSQECAVALSVDLWKGLSDWWDNLHNSRADSEKQAVTPHIGATALIQAMGPVIHQYLSADGSAALNTRVQVLRSTIELFGHDDWAACARKTVVALGGDGKNFAAFRTLTKNTKSAEMKQLFLNLSATAAASATKAATATLQSMSQWSTDAAPDSSKKHKM